MKYYDNSDNFRMREFTVEVALQNGEYKGKIRRKIQGISFQNHYHTSPF